VIFDNKGFLGRFRRVGRYFLCICCIGTENGFIYELGSVS